MMAIRPIDTNTIANALHYLMPTCSAGKAGHCTAAACPSVARERPTTGRWYITMGHAGFNSPANNRDGYASCALALAAHRHYATKGGAK